jgi:ubiquinone/menaquinone biosynthesis C-methylase UbiE
MITTENAQSVATDRELLDAFEPFVTKRFNTNDHEWLEIVNEAARTQAGRRRKRQLLGWLPDFRRTQRSVRLSYLRQWADTGIESQLSGHAKAHYIFRDGAFEAFTQGEKRVHHRLLFPTVERLRPRTVLEVGAGNGLNMLTLAARFPEVHFTGLELTASGMQAAARTRAMPELPRSLAEFSVDPTLSSTAHQKIDLIQGTAENLPFPEDSFDLVFTVLALEQMEEIRNRALSELRRVARHFVLMIEPFRDWNETGIRRDYIIANDYFSARVADLTSYRLQPIYTAEIPAKLVRGVGGVLAKTV